MVIRFAQFVLDKQVIMFIVINRLNKGGYCHTSGGEEGNLSSSIRSRFGKCYSFAKVVPWQSSLEGICQATSGCCGA